MQFYIEVERPGPGGTVLVTLRDGPSPKIGVRLRDEAGQTWRVCRHLPSEVELAPEGAQEAEPKGIALVVVKADAHAA